MIKVENLEYWGFEHAIRGMRNPMNSWDKSDSGWRSKTPDAVHSTCEVESEGQCHHGFTIGANDLSLMQKLFKGGTEHRKYLRQIFVSLDITAPLYWWKEFDTYKVGTVANSCSTMHKIQAKEFELDDFSHEHLSDLSTEYLLDTIRCLNENREAFLSWNESYMMAQKDYWWQMIQLLPSSYNQRRTVTLTYENVFAILHQRAGHKLDEWNVLWSIFNSLPYVKEIRGIE